MARRSTTKRARAKGGPPRSGEKVAAPVQVAALGGTTGEEQAGVFAGRPALLLAAALLVVTIVAYLPAIQSGFIWDDDQYVTQNTTLRSLDGLRRLWIPGETPQYYPLVFTSYWVEHQLWGDRPLGYHVVNVLLHALSAILVWRLALRLGLPGAWMIAAVFALHPVHVESVAWVTERKNVLSGAFYLLAAMAYLRFDEEREEPEGGAARTTRRWYALALGLFVCALLSKTVTSSLPAALILMLLLRGRRLSVRMLTPLVPMFAIGLVLGLHTAHLERTLVGASGPDFDFSIVERLAIASRAFLFYPWKLLFPSELCFNYTRWQIDTGSVAAFWAVPVIAAAFAAAGIAWWRKRRGPLIALAFYAISIFPALGFFDVYPMIYSFVADHFQYLASLGIIAFVVGAGMRLLGNGRLAAPIGGVVLVGLGAVTWYQGKMYQHYDKGRLWEWTLKYNPESWLAHTTLGLDRCREGKLDEGEKHLLAARDIKPDSALVHSNIGQLRLARGEQGKALASYTTAAALDEQFAIDVAQVLMGMGRGDEAEPWLRRALEAAPGRLAPRHWLAQGLLGRGAIDEAATLLEEARRIDPGFFPAHLLLGDIGRARGRFDDCETHYRDALACAERDADRIVAQTRLAGLLSTWPGAADAARREAIVHAEAARDLSGARDPDALAVLAGAYAAVGRIGDAIAAGEEAARLAREFGQADVAEEIEAMVKELRAERGR